MGRAGGTTTALDGVSGSWYVNQVGDERFRHLQLEVKFRSVYVFVHRHGRRGGPESGGRRRRFVGGEVSCVRLCVYIEKDINIERSWYHVRVEELIGLAHRGVSR